MKEELSPHSSFFPPVWDLLTHTSICPRCGHTWEPRERTPDPLSCPSCHQYLTRGRAPRDLPFEPVHRTVWQKSLDVRWGKSWWEIISSYGVR